MTIDQFVTTIVVPRSLLSTCIYLDGKQKRRNRPCAWRRRSYRARVAQAELRLSARCWSIIAIVNEPRVCLQSYIEEKVRGDVSAAFKRCTPCRRHPCSNRSANEASRTVLTLHSLRISVSTKGDIYIYFFLRETNRRLSIHDCHEVHFLLAVVPTA